MENKVFIHKETGEAKIQIPIMEIGKYREATEAEDKLYKMPNNQVKEMLLIAQKDFQWREWETMRTIEKITPNYEVPEGYETYIVQWTIESFEITKKPSGEIAITN